MAFLTLKDGTGLYFEDVGKGRPIVFIHGWPLSGAMWEYQVEPLMRAGFRCVTYDRRGFGRSDKPGEGYDYATLADDVAQLIEHLELRDATLVGFSMGGGEVVEYLSTHQKDGRVARAVLVSSVVPFLLKTSDNPDGVDARMFFDRQQALRNDRPGFLTEFAEKFFGVGIITSPISMPMLAATCEMAMQASPIATIQCVHTFSHTDFRAKAAAIKIPVLVIHGDSDENVPIEISGKRAAELIPNAELKIYPRASHGLFFTHKTDLNADLAAFASEGRIALAEAAE